MMDCPIRLIATDVDGTLLGEGGRIPDDNVRAIQRAQEKGITVAIASGRFPENVFVLLEDYGLKCPIIGINGAQTVDENLHLLSEHCMETDAAAQVAETLERMGAEFFVFGDHAICTSEPRRPHHSELSQGERINKLGFTYYHGMEEARQLIRGKVYKFFVSDRVPLGPVREALRALPGISLTQSGAHNIEIMPEGVHKGRGVSDLAQTLGIPLSQVMTLGDEDNDIPMLRAAGWGVAVGNASPETKTAARIVTDTNVNAGFARAVEAYAL